MAESFFAKLKTEFYYRRVWPTKAGAAQAVGAWIEDRSRPPPPALRARPISPDRCELQRDNNTASAPQTA